jgi:hypothetical protein
MDWQKYVTWTGLLHQFMFYNSFLCIGLPIFGFATGVFKMPLDENGNRKSVLEMAGLFMWMPVMLLVFFLQRRLQPQITEAAMKEAQTSNKKLKSELDSVGRVSAKSAKRKMKRLRA